MSFYFFKVAEMHAELIDFNTALQQKLSEKEVLADKLRSELEALGGPLPNYDLDTNRCCVNVWIPSAFLTGIQNPDLFLNKNIIWILSYNLNFIMVLHILKECSFFYIASITQ